jgi:excisionase family DNA binding protein
MAGMFYSLKEAAARLGKTEDEVRQLAKDGKLREFRDGSNLLFKIDEVNALLAEGVEVDAGALELDETSAEVSKALEEEAAPALEDDSVPGLEEEAGPALDDSLEEDIFKLDEEAAPAAELVEETDATFGLDLAPEAEGQDTGGTTAEEELIVTEEEQPAAEETAGTGEEISLAQETGEPASESDITDMDTALTGEGANVLGETTGADYDVTEDSMAETAGPAGSSAEASLEEIEGDVNLDSFGSGSGLLDLSLQADDTSLGGILDEIYTAEGGEGEAAPAEAEAGAEGEGGEEASFEEITAEAEHATPEEETTLPEPVAVMPAAALTPVYAEAASDTQSNVLGMLLFLPLLALLYTAIVTIAAMRNVMPSILSSIQGLVWYLMGAAIVATLIVVGASFVVGGERAPKAAKPAMEKIKAEKAKKEKKEKSAKETKPAKEKKGFSLFGKKKAKPGEA